VTLDRKNLREHEQTQELLPWYVNETLEGKDAELVLKHLAACEKCQAERDRLYRLHQIVQENDASAADYKMSFRRVMQRVEVAEKNKESTRDVDQLKRRSRLFPLSIAASVAIGVLTGVVWLTAQNVQRDEYQTLSTNQTNMGAIHRMELGFVSPIPAATMRKALIDTNSSIVSGPDSNGNYLVEVAVPIHMSNSEFLSQIQKIEGITSVRFVEN
jgi:hypothetical protein